MTVAELMKLLGTMEPNAQVFLYTGKAAVRINEKEARPTGVFERGNDRDLPGGADASPNDVFIG